ncbi:8-amino-7-oxononanoate synthase, partial [Planctomicrobium sp.]
VTGHSHWHEQLVKTVAEFKKAEAAILFPTGYAANFGTITSLVGSEDIVFCDRLNHASLIDGARHSKAKFRVYPHCDVAALKRELEKARGYRRRLVITDSLFSMDGDQAPLKEIVDLAEEYDAMLLVDEAHATGIFGVNGTGLLEAHEVANHPNVISVGTFSKAIGVQGGFVTGSKSLCDWLWNRARTSMFSTALAPPLCAAAIASIGLIKSEPKRRKWLLEQSKLVKEKLQEQGWNVPEDVNGPIIPVLIREPEKTVSIAKQLQQQVILVAAIRPPTVPSGTSRLRISLSYSHQESGVQALLDAFDQLDTTC